MLKKLDEISPKMCRLVASDKGGFPISQERLAKRCGFSKNRIIILGRTETWRDMTMRDAETYAKGCGLDLWRLRTTFRWRLRRMKNIYHNLTKTQRRMYDRLLPKPT